MKKLLLAIIAISGAMASTAQDTTAAEKADTIRIGGMVIIKKSGKNNEGKDNTEVVINRTKRKPSNVSTNWWIVDLGFANLNDKTDYASAEAIAFAPGLDKDKLELKTTKSVNVN